MLEEEILALARIDALDTLNVCQRRLGDNDTVIVYDPIYGIRHVKAWYFIARAMQYIIQDR